MGLNKRIKSTPPLDRSQRNPRAGPLWPTLNRNTLIDSSWAYSGERSPLDFLCTHSLFPTTEPYRQVHSRTAGLSAFHTCLVLSAFSYRKEWQSHLCRLFRPRPLVTEGGSSSGEWPQDKLHYFYIFRHNHSPASLQETWGTNLKIHLFPCNQSSMYNSPQHPAEVFVGEYSSACVFSWLSYSQGIKRNGSLSEIKQKTTPSQCGCFSLISSLLGRQFTSTTGFSNSPNRYKKHYPVRQTVGTQTLLYWHTDHSSPQLDWSPCS